MTVPIAIIDAFTSEPFRGNPAAVCLLEQEAQDEWMQNVAAEMNLSDTAFLLRQADGSYSLRWFTPQTEVDLCGHATLASAHYLWESGHLGDLQHQVSFHTRSGLLTAEKLDNGGVQLNFPAEPVEPIVAPEELIQALGLIPRYVGRNRMDYVVEVDSEETVRTLKPDYSLLGQVEARGVIITSRADGSHADSRFDFVSRAFFPAVGIKEDPVTGSAHCALAPYWQRRLRKNTLQAYQASPRGGSLQLQVEGNRVLMTGYAVTVLKGFLEV